MWCKLDDVVESMLKEVVLWEEVKDWLFEFVYLFFGG